MIPEIGRRLLPTRSWGRGGLREGRSGQGADAPQAPGRGRQGRGGVRENAMILMG